MTSFAVIFDDDDVQITGTKGIIISSPFKNTSVIFTFAFARCFSI